MDLSPRFSPSLCPHVLFACPGLQPQIRQQTFSYSYTALESVFVHLPYFHVSVLKMHLSRERMSECGSKSTNLKVNRQPS